ncbi:MAG: DNA cytosine methyltransferase [Chitinispirillales bacterium]|jgi:DNA (cytosine-5)-methyltransferase 1|nr:DNA cytosine methyltransferase [Chitinispirillales bacterium]
MAYYSIEICAGAGGQALGLEKAGFKHLELIEIDSNACNTLRFNRPNWKIIEGDICKYSPKPAIELDLLAGGVPCPPFSVAGKQLGSDDERDLFPEALRLVSELKPKAVMLENVRGILDSIFDEYRAKLIKSLEYLGYTTEWRLLNASDFGVSQLRPRVIFIAMRKDIAPHFFWPNPFNKKPPTVGELLYDLMAKNNWKNADWWKNNACDIAPTIVGGSKKHGGPDLGPTRARKAWASLGVDGKGIANDSPEKEFDGMPRLTVEMVARVQGFPADWIFTGSKTSKYRQVGNAFPPPVARTVGFQIKKALDMYYAFAKHKILERKFA